MKVHLVKSTDQTGIPECGWCGREIIPSMGEEKYFLSDAPVLNRVFYHKNCGEKVVELENK